MPNRFLTLACPECSQTVQPGVHGFPYVCPCPECDANITVPAFTENDESANPNISMASMHDIIDSLESRNLGAILLTFDPAVQGQREWTLDKMNLIFAHSSNIDEDTAKWIMQRVAGAISPAKKRKRGESKR